MLLITHVSSNHDISNCLSCINVFAFALCESDSFWFIWDRPHNCPNYPTWGGLTIFSSPFCPVCSLSLCPESAVFKMPLFAALCRAVSKWLYLPLLEPSGLQNGAICPMLCSLKNGLFGLHWAVLNHLSLLECPSKVS